MGTAAGGGREIESPRKHRKLRAFWVSPLFPPASGHKTHRELVDEEVARQLPKT